MNNDQIIGLIMSFLALLGILLEFFFLIIQPLADSIFCQVYQALNTGH